MLKVSYLFPEVNSCCDNREIPAPLICDVNLVLLTRCRILLIGGQS